MVDDEMVDEMMDEMVSCDQNSFSISI